MLERERERGKKFIYCKQERGKMRGDGIERDRESVKGRREIVEGMERERERECVFQKERECDSDRGIG